MTILIIAGNTGRYFWLMNDRESLIKKYDVPVPRYTSYPTVPYWDTSSFSTAKWLDALKRSFHESNDSRGISLYIHLPFCESLCTYCACNTRITRNHQVEIGYIRSLLKEWEMYRKVFGRTPVMRELHLGGGTPTFFSPRNLKWLVSYLLEGVIVHPGHEFSFEGHPNNTTAEHLEVLSKLGFRRVSFGVQDLDPLVQRAINRVQPFENLRSVTLASRDAGFSSVGFDLIYGLPFQTVDTVTATFKKVLSLRPDRVSFYSYAHVPWLRPGQRGYEDADLPTDVAKRKLYETGRMLLKAEGYEDIGMDHFALSHDSLYKAHQNGKLHRNFMGYTTTHTDLLIGLGASAISDAGYAYAQNWKKVEDYANALSADKLPVFKGHLQTAEDRLVKKCIIDLACNGVIRQENLVALNDKTLLETLFAFCNEGILRANLDGFQLTDEGRAFLRNVCAALDRRLNTNGDQTRQTFSLAM